MIIPAVVFATLFGAAQPLRPIVIDVCGATTPPDIRRIEVRAWPGGGAREGRLALWTAFVNGSRQLCLADARGPETADMRALRETAGVITRNQALFAPLTRRDTRVRVTPASAVRVHILESADAIVIVGLNDAAKTRRVKIAFPPDMPEAIWQEMEEGRSVNFVMEKTGPTYTHTFAPHDVLVLAIRKTLR